MDKLKSAIESLTAIRSVTISRADQLTKDRLITTEVDIALAYINSPDTDTGIDVITKQFWEQKDKHGFTLETDIVNNPNEQLAQGAVFVLTEDPDDYPDGWGSWFMDSIRAKGTDVDATIEKLGIAGGLIAAEINRLKAIKNV